MTIGMTIDVEDLDQVVDGEAFQEKLRSGVQSHLVVRLRAKHVTPGAYAALGRLMGSPVVFPEEPALPDFPAIQLFDLPPRPDRDPALDEGEAQTLHNDFGHEPAIPTYALLYQRNDGGFQARMTWVDMRAVLAGLSPELRERAGRHTFIYPQLPGQVFVKVQRETPSLDDALRAEGPSHPLVCSDPRGGPPYLFLPVYRDAQVNGLSHGEGRALLSALWKAVEESPARWQALLCSGDLYVWDNARSLHDRSPYNSAFARVTWFQNVARRVPVAA